jgi:hypothetical protein
VVVGPAGHGNIPEISTITSSQFVACEEGNRLLCPHLIIESLMLHYLANAGIIFKTFVEGKFIPYPKTDHKGNCHTYCESADINKGSSLVFQQIPPGDPEKGFKHKGSFGIKIIFC